jgi:hypothetical protein
VDKIGGAWGGSRRRQVDPPLELICVKISDLQPRQSTRRHRKGTKYPLRRQRWHNSQCNRHLPFEANLLVVIPPSIFKAIFPLSLTHKKLRQKLVTNVLHLKRLSDEWQHTSHRTIHIQANISEVDCPGADPMETFFRSSGKRFVNHSHLRVGRLPIGLNDFDAS